LGAFTAIGMALFLATHLNKIDRKGRVSVPAAYRKALEATQFKSLILLQSPVMQALECMSPARFERYAEGLDRLGKFSEDEGAMATAVFSLSQEVEWDNEGRISIPPEMLAYAHISEQAMFAGAGQTFQIWEPAAFKQRQSDAVSRLRNGKLTLDLNPNGGGAK
jgi:MraZ protein